MLVVTAPKRFIMSEAEVAKIVDPWTCETCKRTYQEKAEVYIHYRGKDFCCSKCFRIYERKKHAEDLKSD